MELVALAQLASTKPSERRPLNDGAAELPLQAALVSSGRPAPPEAVVGVGSEPPCLLALAVLGGCSAARHDPVTPRHARQRRWSWEVAPQTEHVGALVRSAWRRRARPSRQPSATTAQARERFVAVPWKPVVSLGQGEGLRRHASLQEIETWHRRSAGQSRCPATG